ncbi:hypothetical protein [Halarchaeum sp. P4]|uniref:hypothetical protein n=1 Tax=Halarchaeum sp. P4 TaxID=3421639 RepID=UPI003EB968FB
MLTICPLMARKMIAVLIATALLLLSAPSVAAGGAGLAVQIDAPGEPGEEEPTKVTADLNAGEAFHGNKHEVQVQLLVNGEARSNQSTMLSWTDGNESVSLFTDLDPGEKNLTIVATYQDGGQEYQSSATQHVVVKSSGNGSADTGSDDGLSAFERCNARAELGWGSPYEVTCLLDHRGVSGVIENFLG